MARRDVKQTLTPPISIRLAPDQLEQLARRARKQERSISAEIRQIVKVALNGEDGA